VASHAAENWKRSAGSAAESANEFLSCLPTGRALAAGTPATTLYRYDTQGHLVEEIAGSAATASGISVTAGQSLATYVWKDDTPSGDPCAELTGQCQQRARAHYGRGDSCAVAWSIPSCS
jgi:hypothetical protein